MAHPFSSFLESPKTTAFWLLFASLLPFLLPFLALFSSFLLLLAFPFAFAFLFLALSRKFFSSLACSLSLCLPDFALPPSSRQHAAAFPYPPPAPLLQPAESPNLLHGPGPPLPAPPDSALQASDGCFSSRYDRCASLDETPLLHRRKSSEAMLSPWTTPVSEAETATNIPSTISSSSSEADEQKRVEQGTSQDDEEDVVFQDSSEELSPCELEPSVSLASVESASQETTDTKEVEDVSNTPILQGTEHHLRVSRIADSLGSRREELPELSVEESGEFETTSVHPEWKDESTSHRELEGMPRTEVLHSDKEQASELRHEIPEEIADVPQPIDIEPTGLSVREPMEGLKPTVGEDEASSEAGLGFAADPFSAYEIACPACPHDAPEMLDEQAFSRDSAREELPELSVEEVSGEVETTSVHPEWKDESTSYRELEGLPRMEVLHSDNEQASELRHEIPEEIADVPQPIDIEPTGLSVREPMEGLKPTVGDDEASSEAGLGFARHEIPEEIASVPQPIDIEPTGLSVREPMEGLKSTVGEDEASSEARLGFAADPFSAYEIACPACPHDAPEILEEQAFNRDSSREELPELSVGEVSGEFETTSVHPEWKDESTSQRELEGMPRTEVLHSDNEQASELRYEIPEEIADVPQPIDIEPTDLSVRKPMEGLKPTVGEDEASSEAGLGFAADPFSAYEIACPASPHDAPEMVEEQAFNRDSAREDLYQYTGAGAAESDVKKSEDEKIGATCASSSNIGGVSESGIESLEAKDKEDDSEAETCSRATPVLESMKQPTEDPLIMARSSKETSMLADIDAIKKIVGYQGALHGCIVEQIRALYVFVGMEPSSSIVNTDDQEKAWEELEILKAVIGIE